MRERAAKNDVIPAAGRSVCEGAGTAGIYAPGVTAADSQLLSRLTDRFSAHVLDAADLPPARASDLRESCEISIGNDDSLLRLS